MSYWFSKEAEESLTKFSQEVKKAILQNIDEAAEKGFFNSESYSFVYDHHGDAWDKLDLKEEPLNHRVFFMKNGDEFVILEIFDRDELDYEEKGFYNQLKKITEGNKE